MLLKICFLLLTLVPFLSDGQSVGKWKLYINQKEIVSATDDSVQTIQVYHRTDTTLKFVFAAVDTAFIRKVIVMDEQRTGIDSKKVTTHASDAVFNIQELYQQSKGVNLTFYIVDVPANPAKATLVRVAPRPICHLQWN